MKLCHTHILIYCSTLDEIEDYCIICVPDADILRSFKKCILIRDSRRDTLFIEVKSESLGRESLIVLHKKVYYIQRLFTSDI